MTEVAAAVPAPDVVADDTDVRAAVPDCAAVEVLGAVPAWDAPPAETGDAGDSRLGIAAPAGLANGDEPPVRFAKTGDFRPRSVTATMRSMNER